MKSIYAVESGFEVRHTGTPAVSDFQFSTFAVIFLDEGVTTDDDVHGCVWVWGLMCHRAISRVCIVVDAHAAPRQVENLRALERTSVHGPDDDEQ